MAVNNLTRLQGKNSQTTFGKVCNEFGMMTVRCKFRRFLYVIEHMTTSFCPSTALLAYQRFDGIEFINRMGQVNP